MIRLPDVLPAHTPLPSCYRAEAKHRVLLRRTFDAAASDAERIERVLALGFFSEYTAIKAE